MVKNGAIPKGFILKARCIEDSEIAHAPPHVREVWDLILRKANFQDRKYNGTTIRRGQWLTRVPEIRELLHWRVGARKERYATYQIETATKLLRRWGMVATSKTARGMFITVLNYDLYQSPDNYESRTESRDENRTKAERQLKNEKNGNNKGSLESLLRRVFPKALSDCQVSERARAILSHRNGRLPSRDLNCRRCYRPGAPAWISADDDETLFFICEGCYATHT